MTYQVLARKWRPKKFEEVVGQSHITCSLQNSIKENRIGHAYLLTGTRGVGKTTVARIFSKALRCQNRLPDFNPCLECETCRSIDNGQDLNVMEIDGASHNGVEHIRQLVENVQYVPTSGQYKIYIIDEVHMLSTSAFNALLKTLEEPPAHALFILATTDPQKLLGTVLSRCQRFDFRHISVEGLKNHLTKICQKENIEYESEEMMRQVAKLGKGSARDSLSLLDQVLSYTIDRKITEDVIVNALGLARTSAVNDLLESLLIGDSQKVSKVYRACLQENVDLEQLCFSILDQLFNLIQNIDDKAEVEKIVSPSVIEPLSTAEIFWIYEAIVKDFEWGLKSLDPEKVIELMLKKVSLRRTFFTTQKNAVVEKKTAEAPVSTTPKVEVPKAEEQAPVQETKVEEPAPVVEEPAPVQEVTPEEPKEKTWRAFLNHLAKTSPAKGANLEQGNILSELAFTDKGLEIEIGFDNASKVFLDYLDDRAVFPEIVQSVADYFEKKPEEVHLSLRLIQEKESEERNFKSRAQELQEQAKNEMERKEQELRLDPAIVELQNVFNSQVDKVIIE